VNLTDILLFGVLAFALIVVGVALAQPRNDEFDNDDDGGHW
jgi:glucose uptake protein GlcU